jgi:hypothetical protein
MDNLLTPVIHPSTDPFAMLSDRIVAFANKLIPERPFHQYQHEFAFAVVYAVVRGAAEELTALFARQSGKTETIARVAVALAILLPYFAQRLPRQLGAFHKGIWIGVFAPVKDQASTSFERMTEVLESERGLALLQQLDVQIVENNKTSRLLSTGSFVRIWSASPGANIESKTLHLAIVEEAQDVGTYKISKSIEPMLTATAGTLVLIGTANTLKSLFWETIERNRRKQGAQKLHFQYDWKTVVRYSRNYRKFLNKKVEDRGLEWIKTDSFRMAYGCEFILERGQFMAFSRYVELEKLGAGISFGPYDSKGKCLLKVSLVAGIDWGKSSDSTVVTIIAKHQGFCQIVAWLEMLGDDYDTQFDSIVSFLGRFPTLEMVLAETNGVGDPMVDRLKKAARTGKIRAAVAGFLATADNNSEGYKNLLMDFVGSNKLLFPADAKAQATPEYQRFGEQLTDVVKQWKGTILKVCAPEVSSAKGQAGNKKHDDYVSSLMIAYWGASRMSSAEVFRDFYR